jgi:triacylglycerol lipase
MKWKFAMAGLLYAAVIGFIANSFLLVRQAPLALLIMIPVFVWVNICAGSRVTKIANKRFRICQHGTVLLCGFYISVILSTVFQIWYAFHGDGWSVVWSILFCTIVHCIVFWNGILCVYLTSTQLGIKLRTIGILCGIIPIANLIALYFIIKATAGECILESTRQQRNLLRKNDRVCATKYPTVMVHGVFFRDSRFFNYWGRIPKELEDNGAQIFYGNHPSAASVADSAAILKERIGEILAQTGAEKVNLIAHSKGGLDCRYAISRLGISNQVASLTTVNTPHRGCLFADYLLSNIPSGIKDTVAQTYNATLQKFGEADADFLAAVNDLTDGSCKALDAQMPIPEGVYCQSVGSVMKKANGGQFPLNFSYHLVNHFSDENDGLVSEDSFSWGQNYRLLKPSGKRGISHGDMIDLNRTNIPGFDVREFYVELVSDLKNRGL